MITNFDSAIDIGCNCGIYSKLISDFGFKEVRGIDIDQPLLDIANKNVAVNSGDKKIVFENFNAENLAGDGLYDFILCTEVIEHTKDPDKVIANIKRILKPRSCSDHTSECNVLSLFADLAFTQGTA